MYLSVSQKFIYIVYYSGVQSVNPPTQFLTSFMNIEEDDSMCQGLDS